jgi:hypothetical protein
MIGGCFVYIRMVWSDIGPLRQIPTSVREGVEWRSYRLSSRHYSDGH